jgi:hypothetical protein
MRVCQKKVYMVHNFVSTELQLTVIISGQIVRDIIICKYGGSGGGGCDDDKKDCFCKITYTFH